MYIDAVPSCCQVVKFVDKCSFSLGKNWTLLSVQRVLRELTLLAEAGQMRLVTDSHGWIAEAADRADWC